jgi:hypothetical protein
MICLVALIFGQLTLPATIVGDVGSFVPVAATTEGKAVKFVALDQGLQVFPAGLLVNPKATVVVANRAGRFRLLAYSSIGDVPTEPVIAVVVIGNQPGPLPGPVDDELVEALSGIWGGLQDGAKGQKLSMLIEAYKQSAKSVQESPPSTTEKLFELMQAERKKSGLQDSDLLPIRQRLGVEWSKAMGTTDVAMSPALLKAGQEFLNRAISALEQLR